MKLKLCLLSLIFSFTSAAYANQYLKCIGKEEAYIHKMKIGGSYKKLNQALIQQLIMFHSSIHMRKELEKKICSGDDKFPSLEVIKNVFLGKAIFYTTYTKSRLRDYSIDQNSISEFREQSKFIFIDFLTDMLSEVDDPHCLVKQFPPLKDFFLRSKYILEDVGIEKLISEIKNKDQMFNKLKDLSWKQNCIKKP